MSAFRTASNATTDCIDNCLACEQLCLETRSWCESAGGALARDDFLGLLALCAEACSASARAMQDGSDAYVFLCEACAQLSQRCAEALGAMSAGEPRLRACAAACANCARCCAEMARSPETGFEARWRRAS